MDGALKGYIPFGSRLAVSFSTTQGWKFLSNEPGQDIVDSKLTNGRNDRTTHLEVMRISEVSDSQYFALRFVNTGRYVYRNLGLGTLETASHPYYPLNVSYDFEFLRPTVPLGKSSLDLKGFDHADLRLRDLEKTPIELVSVQKLWSPQRLSRRPDPPDSGEEEESFCERMHCTVLCDSEVFADTTHPLTITTYDEDTDREFSHVLSQTGLQKENRVSAWIEFPRRRLASLRLLNLALEDYDGPLDPLKIAHVTLIVEESQFHYARCDLDLHLWISDDLWIVMSRPFVRYENCFASLSNLGITGPQLAHILSQDTAASPATMTPASQGQSNSLLTRCSLTARGAVQQIKDFVEKNIDSDEVPFAYNRRVWSAHSKLDPYTVAARVINMLIVIRDKASSGIERALRGYFEIDTATPFISDQQWNNTLAMLRGRRDVSNPSPELDKWPIDHRFYPDGQGQMIGPMPLEVAVIASAAFGDPHRRREESGRALSTFFEALRDSHNPLRFAIVVVSTSESNQPVFCSEGWYDSDLVHPPMNLGPITNWQRLDPGAEGSLARFGVQIVMQAPGVKNSYTIAIHTSDEHGTLSAKTLSLDQINQTPAAHTRLIDLKALRNLTHKTATGLFDDHWRARSGSTPRERRSVYQFAHAHFSTLDYDLKDATKTLEYKDATIHAVISDGFKIVQGPINH